MNVKSTLIVAVFQFATFCLTLNAQHGISPFWGTQIEIPKAHPDGSARGSVGNNMVIISDEKIITFFNETYPFPGTSVVIYYTISTDGGNTWTVPELFIPASGSPGSCCPNIALDAEDNIHVVWQAKAPLGVYYAKLDSDMNILSDAAMISDEVIHEINDVGVSVDRKNRVHVMWHDGDTHASDHAAEVRYVRSPDGGETWEAQQTLSDDDGQHSAFARVDFSGAIGDDLAIPWRDSVGPNDWDVVIAVTHDGGQNWVRKTAAGGSGRQWDPGLIVDKHGYFQLNFHEYPVDDPFLGARVKVGTSTDFGETWSDFQVISEDDRSELTTFNYDYTNDRLWVFWKDERDIIGPDLMCAYSNDQGMNWSDAEFLTDQGDDPVGFKGTAVSPNGTLAINYELPTPSTGLSTLFFRKREIITAVNETFRLEEKGAVIFPNPTAGDFRIELEEPFKDKVALQIVNSSGQIILEQEVPENAASISVDLNNNSPGIYVLFIHSTEKILFKKIALLR